MLGSYLILTGSCQGTHSILEEESHIKDALSRIIVEMIKREWPQNWPDMLKEMEALTSHGVSDCMLQEPVYHMFPQPWMQFVYGCVIADRKISSL